MEANKQILPSEMQKEALGTKCICLGGLPAREFVMCIYPSLWGGGQGTLWGEEQPSA